MGARRDTQSWEKGRDDALRGRPSVCPESFDPMAYESGYYAGMRSLARETDLQARRASKSKYRAAP
jgi:hypothetical protein